MTLLLVAAALTAIILLPSSASAAVCADYSTQADAQRAADTRDSDSDGVYCESLPCPCLTDRGSTPLPTPSTSTPNTSSSSCIRPRAVQRLVFNRSKYPNIRAHYVRAVAKGWPRIMVVNRKGTDARRDRLLEGIPTKAGFDRDEYPAAVGRGKRNGTSRGLVAGINPTGWMADVEYVPSGENRSHGSSLGRKLRRFCDGVRFRYIFA